jgi:hypothetical protein
VANNELYTSSEQPDLIVSATQNGFYYQIATNRSENILQATLNICGNACSLRSGLLVSALEQGLESITKIEINPTSILVKFDPWGYPVDLNDRLNEFLVLVVNAIESLQPDQQVEEKLNVTN